MTDFKEQMIRNIERGFTTEARAYEFTRDQMIDAADFARDQARDRLGNSGSDLSPFAQGYVGEMFAGVRFDPPSGLLGFYDLSPEALALILRDCEAFEQCEMAELRNAAEGGWFWRTRQSGLSEELRDAFPPLTVFLNDDGKVCLKQHPIEVK